METEGADPSAVVAATAVGAHIGIEETGIEVGDLIGGGGGGLDIVRSQERVEAHRAIDKLPVRASGIGPGEIGNCIGIVDRDGEARRSRAGNRSGAGSGDDKAGIAITADSCQLEGVVGAAAETCHCIGGAGYRLPVAGDAVAYGADHPFALGAESHPAQEGLESVDRVDCKVCGRRAGDLSNANIVDGSRRIGTHRAVVVPQESKLVEAIRGHVKRMVDTLPRALLVHIAAKLDSA